MHTLFLDIASHTGLIACCSDSAVASSRVCEERVGDSELIPFVEEVLQQAQWTYEDLTHIACINGPGGFTGLRVAAAFTNTLADQLSIPSAGVHMSDYYRARVQEESFLWLHSTKKTELFVRGFGEYADLWKEPTHIDLEEFIQQYPSGAPWSGELLLEHQEKIGAQELTLADPLSILPSFVSSLQYDSNLVLPWYGRGW